MQGLGTALRSISRGKSPSQDRDRSGLCVGRRFLPQARGLRMKEARGIYRVRRIGGLGSDARVTDGTTLMDVPESDLPRAGLSARPRQAALAGRIRCQEVQREAVMPKPVT